MNADATTEENLRYRQRLWESFTRDFLWEAYIRRGEKPVLDYLERLYFGEPLDPEAEVLAPFLARRGHSIVFHCLQKQDPEG